jgi:hypothetical protein
MKILAAALALLTLPACAQTWVKIAAENTNTYVTLPAGTQYRFGTPLTTSTAGCGTLGWLTGTATSVTTLSAYYTSFACDPAPGVVKELDVLQTSAAQTIVVVNNGTLSSVTIPALAVATQSASTKPTITGTFSCVGNLLSDGTYVSTSCTTQKVGK